MKGLSCRLVARDHESVTSTSTLPRIQKIEPRKARKLPTNEAPAHFTEKNTRLALSETVGQVLGALDDLDNELLCLQELSHPMILDGEMLGIVPWLSQNLNRSPLPLKAKREENLKKRKKKHLCNPQKLPLKCSSAPSVVRAHGQITTYHLAHKLEPRRYNNQPGR